jgi:hypothetical protein
LWVRASFGSNQIDGIMDSILTSSVVDCGLEPHSVQTKG